MVDTPTQDMVLRPQWLVDGVSSEAIEGSEVRISQGRIVHVGPAGATSTDGARVIDLPGRSLLPGLIDCHTHYPLDGSLPSGNSVELATREPSEKLMLVAARNARIAVEAGVTTARSAGAPRQLDIPLSEAIDRGDVPGPRLLAAGQSITITGGHGMHFGMEADSVTEMVRAVRTQVAAGAQVIKAIASEAAQRVDSVAGIPEMTATELTAIVTDAARLRRRVLAHAQGSDSVKAAAAAGVASVEHAFLADDDALDALARSGVALCPTLVVTDVSHRLGNMTPAQQERNAVLLESHRRSASTAIRLGIPIITGTDCGVRGLTPDLVWREVAILAELGMTLMDALKAATSVSARILGVADEVGTIEDGKRADVVIAAGNVTDTIEGLSEPELVMKDGSVVIDRGGRSPFSTYV